MILVLVLSDFIEVYDEGKYDVGKGNGEYFNEI